MNINNDNLRAAGVLFFSSVTKRCLLLLRSSTKYTDTWGIVGGKAEKNESILECLKREISEEIQQFPSILKTIPIDLYISPDSKFEYHTFICVVENEFIPILNNEHSAFKWSYFDNLPNPMHPGLFHTLQLPEVKTKISYICKKNWTI